LSFQEDTIMMTLSFQKAKRWTTDYFVFSNRRTNDYFIFSIERLCLNNTRIYCNKVIKKTYQIQVHNLMWIGFC